MSKIKGQRPFTRPLFLSRTYLADKAVILRRVGNNYTPARNNKITTHSPPFNIPIFYNTSIFSGHLKNSLKKKTRFTFHLDLIESRMLWLEMAVAGAAFQSIAPSFFLHLIDHSDKYPPPPPPTQLQRPTLSSLGPLPLPLGGRPRWEHGALIQLGREDLGFSTFHFAPPALSSNWISFLDLFTN